MDRVSVLVELRQLLLGQEVARLAVAKPALYWGLFPAVCQFRLWHYMDIFYSLDLAEEYINQQFRNGEEEEFYRDCFLLTEYTDSD